nr:MAG TPA: Recombination enhancement, RecA-dependent nuclease [Caudoviricetes sp.]
MDLCHECHNEPPNGVHFSNIQCRFLQKIAQIEAMRYYGWSKDEFMQIFGRNYL